MESANRKPIVRNGFVSQKGYRLDSIRDRHIRHELDRQGNSRVGLSGTHADVIGVEGNVMMFHCPQPPREFVGQRNGSLVVTDALLQRQRPGL
jgi:negative regulator of sigma E activity